MMLLPSFFRYLAEPAHFAGAVGAFTYIENDYTK